MLFIKQYSSSLLASAVTMIFLFGSKCANDRSANKQLFIVLKACSHSSDHIHFVPFFYQTFISYFLGSKCYSKLLIKIKKNLEFSYTIRCGHVLYSLDPFSVWFYFFTVIYPKYFIFFRMYSHFSALNLNPYSSILCLNKGFVLHLIFAFNQNSIPANIVFIIYWNRLEATFNPKGRRFSF